ncbi:MAG: HAD family hydrolase [Anaerolineales bacterium]|nr:HAD family hydrolase [Anaerolineales bacterium]
MAEQRAAFFDLDGTLTDDRTWKGILGYFQSHRLRRGTHALFLAIHYPQYAAHRLGLVGVAAFRRNWAAHLSWYFRGYTLEQGQAVWDWAVEHFFSAHWRPETRRILEQHRQAGDLVMLVSSAPHPLVERVAREVGADHALGTRFEVRDGRFTGRSVPPACSDEAKGILAIQYLQQHGLEVDLQASFAYADSIADLPLLTLVGRPVAVYPDESLKSIAHQRGWRIVPE